MSNAVFEDRSDVGTRGVAAMPKEAHEGAKVSGRR